MKTVSATEANRQFSKLLGDVQRGETVRVTSHGKAIARIVPEPDSGEEARDEAFAALIRRLRSQPALNLGPFSRDDAYGDDHTDDPA